MRRTATADPGVILRRLTREVQDCIRLLEAHPQRTAGPQGQLEAMRHVATFLRNQEPSPTRQRFTKHAAQSRDAGTTPTVR